jgi:hypothetical protein
MPELSDEEFAKMKKELEEMDAKCKSGEISEAAFTKYVIETQNKLLKDVHEIDLRMAHDYARDICEIIHNVERGTSVYESKIKEGMGEYGPQWIIKFKHGNYDFVKGKKKMALRHSDLDVVAHINGFFDKFQDKVSLEVVVTGPDKFTVFMNKKMFEPFDITDETGRVVQRVRPVDPEYCGIDLETQKEHAKIMTRDIRKFEKEHNVKFGK